uniref:LRRCT domain-containing protein n=1 Tax=Oreochromis niloticus TaxID=8128 RepID=A0A669E3Y6_ORENI
TETKRSLNCSQVLLCLQVSGIFLCFCDALAQPSSPLSHSLTERTDAQPVHLPFGLLAGKMLKLIKNILFFFFLLIHRFIESNKLETTSKYAFRGLRDLTHLSLANNNIKALPRDLFIDLDSLIELDLRGNAFECDCRAKWLMTWLKNTNATVSDVVCAGPEDMKGKRLNDMTSLQNECVSTSVASESLSVDTFSYKNDVYVAISAPSTESCMIFQWDHIEMNFRTYDNITGKF